MRTNHPPDRRPRPATVEKVAVIGAGASGLATARQLHLAGLPFELLERTEDLGGTWRLAEDNAHSAVFESTHANTSRQIMAFSDHEMPDHYPTFPHHTQLLEYLRSYATNFGLIDHLRVNHRVLTAEPVDEGRRGWDITIENVGTRRYRALCVAIGHHSAPRTPNLRGAFSGTTLHARDYAGGARFTNERVLIVGLGASGADIAVDLSNRAAQVDVSVRRGYHIVPKIVFGRPLDHLAFRRRRSMLPAVARRKVADKVLTTLIGDPTSFGFPRPTQGLRDVSPTISQELVARIAQGSIAVRPAVEELQGDAVRFEDGTRQPYDVVIHATGYDIELPFLSDDVIAPGAPLRMYKHVVHPSIENVFFIGFTQPLGAFWPIAEAQARWVAAMLAGDLTRPNSQAMVEEVDRAWRSFAAHDHRSADAFIRVEQDLYLLELWRAMVPEGPGRRRRQRRRRAAPFTELVWKRIEDAAAGSRAVSAQPSRC